MVSTDFASVFVLIEWFQKNSSKTKPFFHVKRICTKPIKMKLKALAFAALAVSVLASCSKDEQVTAQPTVVKNWTIALSAKNENPAPAGRNETGTATLELLSDNSLKYTINVTGLASGDVLNAAHIHTGNVITNGGVILNLNPTFSGSSATGTVTGLRSSFADSLKNNTNELYLNVHSAQVASGLVRGQLNTNIEMAATVALSGANEVPAVTTTATGTALVRLTSDKKLYSLITVTGLEATDALTMAHIHRGAAGVNGAVLVSIHSSAAEFGTAKIITVDDATFTALKTEAIYVNAHSTNRPGGVVRGQIR